MSLPYHGDMMGKYDGETGDNCCFFFGDGFRPTKMRVNKPQRCHLNSQHDDKTVVMSACCHVVSYFKQT